MLRTLRRTLPLGALALVGGLAACGSDNGTGPIVPVPTGPKAGTLEGNITTNRTLFADTVYTLSGYVKVRSGATLTIQPGTKIVGDTLVAGSSLWITRGAKIDAQGTVDKPIVFTSARAKGKRLPGDWGGVIIVGNGIVNRSQGGGVSTIFTEGPQGTGQNTAENYGGGTVDSDNSGTLRYVRIEFAGYAVQANEELNSLSSYAVGSGTKYEYVQAVSGLDDSFEFFGGAPDMRYLVSYEAGDDHFDWTEGFHGRAQYLIAFQTFQPTPRSGAGFVSNDPHGFEGDGCEIDKAGCTSFAVAPYSMPVFANFTLVGPGATASFSGIKDNNGAVVRRGSGGSFVNGVITRWQGTGWNVRDLASDNLRAVDSLTADNVLLADNVGGNFDVPGSVCTAGGGSCGTKANYPRAVDGTVAASTLFAQLPASGAVPDLTSIDWTPKAGSLLLTGTAPTLSAVVKARMNGFFGGSMAVTTYIGAADPAGAKWWAGWTSYDRN
jgi:hypothetical protein